MKRDFFKQKIILYFGYNGKAYHGLQSQKGSEVPTVEGSLYQGLFDSNLVGKSTFGDLHQAGWSRGARTDKGVHALCNSISMKLWITKDLLKEPIIGEDKPCQQETLPDFQNQVLLHQIIQDDNVNFQEEKQEKQEQKIQRPLRFDKNTDKFDIDFTKIIKILNSNLPKDMRAYCCKLVTQTFDVRRSARCRLYEYIVPVCVYQKYEDLKNAVPITEEFVNNLLARLQGVVKRFEGSHNFHNYSRGLRAKDATANRYIMKMDVEKVIYKDVNFLRFKLIGQSFVYHQIRKMIGMTIQLFFEDLPDEFITNTFFSNQLRIILAPAEGLFLNRIYFDGYNKKPDVPEQLVFNEQEEKLLDEFKPIIEEHIYKCEIEDQVFTKWIKDLKEKTDLVQEESEGGGDD